MAVATVSPPPVRSTGPRAGRWRFSVDDYLQLHERGIIPEDVRTELIEGEIRVMSPIGTPHASSQRSLAALLTWRLGARAIVSGQNNLQLDDHTIVQPDVAVLRLDPDLYVDRHPTSADTVLVVEVAMSSLRYDRRRKLPLYARFDVPEVWIAALGEQVLDVYRQPVSGRYIDVEVLQPGDVVAPVAFPDVVLDVGEILLSKQLRPGGD